MVDGRAALVADFPGPEATITLDQHADRALGIIGGAAPAALVDQARAQVLGEGR